MIKASAGGGGKGLRIAWNDKEARYVHILQDLLPVSKKEKTYIFGRCSLFIVIYIRLTLLIITYIRGTQTFSSGVHIEEFPETSGVHGSRFSALLALTGGPLETRCRSGFWAAVRTLSTSDVHHYY